MNNGLTLADVQKMLHFTTLPYANEVWGKVIFSQASVSHSVHWGAVNDVTFCLAAGSHVPSRDLWSHVPSRRSP